MISAADLERENGPSESGRGREKRKAVISRGFARVQGHWAL